MKTKLNELRSDSRAVSPVIGVVLMIAVVVILAAVVGAFATGIFGNQQDAPQAAFSYDADADSVTMESGDAIPSDELTVEGGASFSDSDGDGNVEAGDVASGAGISDTNGDGQISVNWESTDGSQSATLASFDAP